MLAAWSAEPFVPNNNMFAVHLEGHAARAMALFFNSSFFLAQVLLHKQETTRAMIDYKIAEAQHFLVPNIQKLDGGGLRGLSRAFDRLAGRELRPLIHDYPAVGGARRGIDEAVAAALGLDARLHPLHGAIGEELAVMRAMKSAGRT